MLDFVQVVSDHIGRQAGLDEEALHWVGVAVRESVINAIKHGNGNDEAEARARRVHAARRRTTPPGIAIRVSDEGAGFDPATLPDPLAPENLLKSSGRGIFLIRSFMDELMLQRAPEGGMEVVMVKRVQPQRCRSWSRSQSTVYGPRDRRSRRPERTESLPDPVFLATATEIVLRAGDIQLAGQAAGFRVDKKGTIDLVTEIDLECERMCRAVLAERFPDHDILAEELGGSPAAQSRSPYRWVFDPLDGTTNYAHGLPILLRVARPRDRRPRARWAPSSTRAARSCSRRNVVKART